MYKTFCLAVVMWSAKIIHFKRSSVHRSIQELGVQAENRYERKAEKSECIKETYACQCGRGLKNNIFTPTFYLL